MARSQRPPKRRSGASKAPTDLPKVPTGIGGFDQITFGGLPKGRTALICGSAGCGKTLFAMEFLVRGATQFDEPGVFVAFEETEADLAKNVASLGFDLEQLQADGKISLDHILIDRTQIAETGEYDLEGLFVRLGYAIDSIGAKRVVLDTLETLFGGFQNEAVLRAELRRLFGWLKDKGVTAIITAERGEGSLTRQGLEEYVSDCVVLLDHRVVEGVTTRRLRVVKYRGSSHGTNEYPFLIDRDGINVMPVTSLGLSHVASAERVSSGVERLDEMLSGQGYFRGSSVLVSGMAGTGKTSLAAHFCAAACKRGEKALFFSFEESFSQFQRNMQSIGMDFSGWEKRGLFHYHAARPTLHGLEMHLAVIHKMIESVRPDVVVIDPISTFSAVGADLDVSAMIIRLIDHLKGHGVTSLFTTLLNNINNLETTEMGVSSLMDAWILMRTFEVGAERNRGLHILKSRGMAHSNQVREFLFTPHGVELVDVYVGPEGVLTGSARAMQEARDRAKLVAARESSEQVRRESDRRAKVLKAQIAALEADLAAEEGNTKRSLTEAMEREAIALQERTELAGRRGGRQQTAKSSKKRALKVALEREERRA